MDMGTDMSGMNEMGGSTMGGGMMPWLHFSLGDSLFFAGWVPLSAGAVVGACIGLFLLAIIERWLAAMRAVMQDYWTRKTEELLAARLTTSSDNSSFSSDQKVLVGDCRDSEMQTPTPQPRLSMRLTHLRRSAPFIPSHDFARGGMQIIQVALSYALMLAVMSFHAGYIIAIILGLGVGETLFGRFGAQAHQH